MNSTDSDTYCFNHKRHKYSKFCHKRTRTVSDIYCPIKKKRTTTLTLLRTKRVYDPYCLLTNSTSSPITVTIVRDSRFWLESHLNKLCSFAAYLPKREISLLRLTSQSLSVVVHSCIWINRTIPKRYKNKCSWELLESALKGKTLIHYLGITLLTAVLIAKFPDKALLCSLGSLCSSSTRSPSLPAMEPRLLLEADRRMLRCDAL